MNPADLRTWGREMRLTQREAAEVVRADLRTHVEDVPPQNVISRDTPLLLRCRIRPGTP